MKLPIACMVCFEIDGKPSEELVKAEIEDTGLYTVICRHGHTSHTFLQNLKYEILFEFGCISLINEFTREAVANFVSSIERFHEICISTFCLKNGVSESSISELWRSVDNQSERQLGAFYYLYLTTLKRKPPEFIIDTTNAKFRNNILHKGYIPKQSEVMEYGEKVYLYLEEVSILLKSELNEYVDKVRLIYLKNLRDKIKGQKHAVLSVPTALDMTRTRDNRTFQSVIDDLSKYKNWLYLS